MTSAFNRYFELSDLIVSAKADGDFERAVRAARETYALMPTVVEEMKRRYGSLSISVSHAFHTAPALMAVIGDRQGISELRKALQATPELRNWLTVADQADADVDLVDKIVAAANDTPGIKQKDLKEKLDGDTSRLGFLTSRLENCRRLQRVSQGSTYLLYPGGFPLSDENVQPAARLDSDNENRAMIAGPEPSGRTGSAARARKLDFDNIAYVRLPKAPVAWEERPQDSVKTADDSDATRSMVEKRRDVPRFETHGIGWFLSDEVRLSPTERPNSAYRDAFHTAGSTVWIDPRGKRVGFSTAPAIILTTDCAGHPIAERGLAFGVYRTDVNCDGSGMLFLSEEGILHGYSDAIRPILTWHLADIPEYSEQAKRFGIAQRALKNHVRCVALSGDRTRCVVTVVDEAWCFEIATKRPLWGIRFPSKEGWTEVSAERSGRVGADSDVLAALDYMELKLPVSPEAITHQYRALAKRWHPDTNPNDPTATSRFQKLRAAMELLTGIDLSSLSGAESDGIEYAQILRRGAVNVQPGINVTISMTMQIEGAFGADWIYAAHFADSANTVFLGGYSGRIVEVSPDGMPVRVYDIGSVPCQIAKTASHLSILTDTRLYVLREKELVALVDVLDRGELIVGNAGFGLLQAKRFQWLTPTGNLVGEVKTRDPIRRVFYGSEGLTIETRTHRATVRGAQNWW